jgi:hypothetical protein
LSGVTNAETLGIEGWLSAEANKGRRDQSMRSSGTGSSPPLRFRMRRNVSRSNPLRRSRKILGLHCSNLLGCCNRKKHVGSIAVTDVLKRGCNRKGKVATLVVMAQSSQILNLILTIRSFESFAGP